MGTPNQPLPWPGHWLEHRFADALPGLGSPWQPQPCAAPRLLVGNHELAEALGLDHALLRTPAGVAVLAGNTVPTGAAPVAQAYAGHQFGGYSPRLGDGRAVLLGEILAPDGQRYDLHLKGSGRTMFARGGDGRAAVGPMLREYLMAEAMHALGVPTTRMLAVVATGEHIIREADGRAAPVPGAVLARVAASHLRVGTFQFAAAQGDPTLLRALLAFAVERHAPHLAGTPDVGLAFYREVVARQARLVAKWMEVGFIHGVMNTDNMALSGETIDYGPCAFMDAYDPATVYSSIDHGGRYAYGNQPSVAAWNLARLAEAMLPLLAEQPDDAVAAATEVLGEFPEQLHTAWAAGMRTKLGLGVGVGDGFGDSLADEHGADQGADEVAGAFLGLLAAQGVDYTSAFRSLSDVLRGDRTSARALFADGTAFDTWAERWLALADPTAADEMDRRNPVYIPRNHLVEEALAAAAAADIGPFETLLAAVRQPFTAREGSERFAAPAPREFAACYRTFCGT